MESTARIVQLASLIASYTEAINNYLNDRGFRTPSFSLDALDSPGIPSDAANIQAARASVISACSELKDLLTGPRSLLKFQWTDYVSVKAILRFKLDQSFDVDSSTNFKKMSELSGLDERTVRRIVRHGIINHRFFCENEPGVITHSALTAILAQDPAARNSLVVELDEFWPAGVHMADAMEQWPNSEECNETGFTVANHTTKSMYDFFADHPDRGERFARYFSKPEPVAAADEILDNYDWAKKRKMVDVGGSHGAVAIGIARRFQGIQCIVQDLPGPVAEGELRLPGDLKDRVTFVAHDFFKPQPVEADVYFFRSIFHNWPDKYCIKILQNLVPILKTGARIIIHERVLPGLERLDTADAMRAINLDVGMQQLLNAQQRELHEWPELFRRADHRFHYVGAYHPEGAIRWIIEAEWQDEEMGGTA
ncbi:O-methyltransferase-domain-containing protein [Hypoxylon argillaceum]|nr:O-methyltransferase-domain-containing protein [Hypoxylon argillaceum]